jgi:hypothetical protein
VEAHCYVLSEILPLVHCSRDPRMVLSSRLQTLCIQLHHTHIYNANTRQQTWGNIEQSINQKLQQEMKKVCLKQHKIANMTKTQITDTENSNANYTRLENHANIKFTHLNRNIKVNNILNKIE